MLTTLAGVVAALLVYVVTNDVVWTIATVLLTVVVVRRLARRDVAR